MEILVVLLLISHIVVLIVLKNYIADYKKNNYNFLTTELKKIDSLFYKGITNLNDIFNVFTNKSNASFKNLLTKHNDYTQKHQQNFAEVTNFIKTDYKSLTEHLKTNNDHLTKLLKSTEVNITKNNELKPLLV